MGQYDKYPIRNANGYIEYLTRQEIENLRDMGESVEELDGPASNRYPPTAKNPANQARVNELFYEEQRRKAEERRKRRDQRARDALRGAAAAGQIGLAVTGADMSLASGTLTNPVDAGQSTMDIVDTAQSRERERRGRDVRDATRDQGRRRRGTSGS